MHRRGTVGTSLRFEHRPSDHVARHGFENESDAAGRWLEGKRRLSVPERRAFVTRQAKRKKGDVNQAQEKRRPVGMGTVVETTPDYSVYRHPLPGKDRFYEIQIYTSFKAFADRVRMNRHS